MTKNSDGKLTRAEQRELKDLVRQAQEIARSQRAGLDWSALDIGPRLKKDGPHGK